MPNYFSEQKSLTKLNFEPLLPNTSKGHISRRWGSQRQFADTYSKTERKISNNEEQSSDKSDDEESNKPTAESKFEESWQEKRSTKRKRDRDTYVPPPSKKINFEIKMKNKVNAKVETSENAIKN